VAAPHPGTILEPPRAVDIAVGVVPALGGFISAEEEAADLAVADLSGELGVSLTGLRDSKPPCCSVEVTLASAPLLVLLPLFGGAGVPLRRVKPRIFLEAPNPAVPPPDDELLDRVDSIFSRRREPKPAGIFDIYDRRGRAGWFYLVTVAMTAISKM
jgi:hypothetical protein